MNRYKYLPAAGWGSASILDTTNKDQVMGFINRVELLARMGNEEDAKALMQAIGAGYNARSVVADTLSALDKPENWLHT